MPLPVDPRTRYPQPPYRTGRQERPGELADMTPAPDHGEESYVGRRRLVDRVALVTGSDSGIGRAVAIAMAREGADVLVTHLEPERDEAEEVVTLVRNADRRGDRVEVDLSEEDGCRAAVARAVERFDRIDVLVNNAGTQVVVDSFEQITAEVLEHTYRTNRFSMFHMIRHALAHMRPGASIINVASIQAGEPSPALLHYSTTKAAIVTLTEGLAPELMERGIRVNAVAPGATWTPLIPATMPPEAVEQFGAGAPIGRVPQPVELAGAFVFLASDEASFVTGETVAVTGGRTLWARSTGRVSRR